MWRSCDIGRYRDKPGPNGTIIKQYQHFNDCVPVFDDVSLWQFYTYFAARTVFFVIPMATGKMSITNPSFVHLFIHLQKF